MRISLRNIADEFSSSGVEVEASKNFGEKWLLTANYTYTDADERFALRIPEHKVNARLSWMPISKLDLSLNFQYLSDRDDTFFNPDTFASETVVLDSFSLLDFGVGYNLSEEFRLLAGVTNIFNTEYEEIYRFQTPGRNLRFGFSLRL